MKKGFFLPFLAFLTFLVFCSIALAMLIHNHNLENQGKVGLQAGSLYKMYDEGEKINFYLEQSISYAKIESEFYLESEGGYQEENNCQKTINGYNLWNSCQSLNPEESFKLEFKKRLQKYLDNYKSIYEVFPATIFGEDQRVLLRGTEEMRSIINEKINKNQIESFEKEGENFIIKFKPIELEPEQMMETVYRINPTFKITIPDLTIYDQLYLALSNCNSVESCTQKLHEVDENINVEAQGSIIQIDYNDIHFAFDTSKQIQGKSNPLTQA